MLKGILVILAAFSMLFAHAIGTCRAACIVEEQSKSMSECCKAKAKHASDSHKEKSTPAKNPCADCWMCKVPPTPSIAQFEMKVQIAFAGGAVCRLSDDCVISDAFNLPAIPPPRA